MTWPTLIFSPCFDPNLFDHAADRGGNFDHGFVGFQFHHRLAFRNLGAGRNHEAHEIALRDVLSEFGQFEFSWAGSRNGGAAAAAERSGGCRVRWAAASVAVARLKLRQQPAALWAAFAGEGARATLPAPFSKVKITWPTLIFSPSLTRISFTDAAHRRRHFDDRLVGFQFHHRLAFGDGRAGRNHQPDEVSLIDVFAEFR